MSWKASAYIKELIVCPNGERISRSEKLIALVLAESHQVHGEGTFPSLQSMAVDALMDERSARRLLGSLERKGAIVRRRAERQGRGQMTFYFFPALEAVQESKSSPETGTKPVKKGGQIAPLFFGEKEDRRRTEGGQNPHPHIEEQEQEQKLTTPPVAPQGGARVSPEVTPEVGPRLVEHVREEGVERAVDQVCSALGIANGRKRKVLRATIVLAAEKGETLGAIALAMIAAWNDQATEHARGFLRFKFGLTVFFGDGYWRSRDRWPWDHEAIERFRGASIGSY